jgi:hypothetical protein
MANTLIRAYLAALLVVTGIEAQTDVAFTSTYHFAGIGASSCAPAGNCGGVSTDKDASGARAFFASSGTAVRVRIGTTNVTITDDTGWCSPNAAKGIPYALGQAVAPRNTVYTMSCAGVLADGSGYMVTVRLNLSAIRFGGGNSSVVGWFGGSDPGIITFSVIPPPHF